MVIYFKMADDINCFRESDGRIYVKWKIWGFLENLFLKKNTSSYNPYIEVNSPSISLFNSTWRIQLISSIYERWLKMRLYRMNSRENLFGVPVSYRMGIETTFGDKYGTTELQFSFTNNCVGEWCKICESSDLNHYKIQQNDWRFAGLKDTATVFCSFLLDPNSEDVEFQPQKPSSEDTISSSDNCKGTMTSPADFTDLYHSKGTLTSPEDLNDLYLCKGTMTSSKDSEEMLLIKDSVTLSENFKELFISKYYTDVTIKVKGREFHVHRIVLAARSKVFASMFKHETAEKSSGLVEISDCDPDSFEDFLLYLYAGKVDVSPISAVNLYKTSDKYDVEELRGACVRCMERGLTVDSFSNVVHLATIHNEAELLTVAVNFFIVNLDLILPTTKWQTFLEQYPLLANELFMKTLRK